MPDRPSGAFYRRRRGRLAPASALVASAHTIVWMVERLLTYRTPWRDLHSEEYPRQTWARAIAARRKKAARGGLTLVESPA